VLRGQITCRSRVAQIYSGSCINRAVLLQGLHRVEQAGNAIVQRVIVGGAKKIEADPLQFFQKRRIRKNILTSSAPPG
jgi:hypothetical protein